MSAERTAIPHWPKAAASAVVLRDGCVLLAERGKGPRAGTWSLPGGHIEPGETASDAAIREVYEETGIVLEIRGIADVHDVILRDDDGVLAAHYLLAVFYGHGGQGEPVAATDCRCARFVPLEEIAGYGVTEAAQQVIARAVALLAADGATRRVVD